MWDEAAVGQLDSLPWVRHVEFYPTIGSTNDRARELLEGDTPLPALVIAAQQTRGRGRLGRTWWSPPGALLCSVALPAEHGPRDREQAPVLALWTGVALADGLSRVEPRLPLWLKWPNDLMVGHAKLGGVLVECVARSSEPPQWVVGFGLNINNRRAAATPDAVAPDRHPPLSLYDFTGRIFPLVDVLATVLHSLASTYTALRSKPNELPDQWKRYCGLCGRVIEVAPPDGKRIQGVCLSVAPDGALVLRTAGGHEQRCTAGSVIEWES